MNLKHHLRDAFRRTQAPADLADRVLARINDKPSRQAGPASSDVRRWLAAAAVLAIAVGAGHYYEQQRQAAEAARLQEELRIALQITNETLARVQRKLSQPAEEAGR
jgi:predicted nucleic acid-binding Zn ribbon protein